MSGLQAGPQLSLPMVQLACFHPAKAVGLMCMMVLLLSSVLPVQPARIPFSQPADPL